MAMVPEDRRLDELRRLGLSEPLIRLSAGDCVHPSFRDSLLGPPWYSYHSAEPPPGPPFVPLWDRGDTIVGVRETSDGLEFLAYSIEAEEREAITPVARSEQGFWATCFDILYENDVPIEELREASAAVGFRFFDRYLASRESAEQLNTFEGHRAWQRQFIADIDGEPLQ